MQEQVSNREVLQATTKAPWMARRVIESRLQDQSRELVDTILLLVSELVTNCIRHAGLGPDASVSVSLSALPDRIRVEVTDPGPGFHRRRIERTPTKPGALGLFLVDTLSSDWGTREDPFTVWFEIGTPRSPSSN